MRRTTQQSGASDERDAVKAYLLRRRRQHNEQPGRVAEYNEVSAIINWLNGRAARFRKKAGGLGARGGR